MPPIIIDRVTGLRSSAAIKSPVKVISVTDIPLSGLQTIDDVTLADGDRVLVAGNTDQRENGIYVAGTGAWDRASDFNRNGEVMKGTRIRVNYGTAYGGNDFILETDDPIEFGASNLIFSTAARFSAPVLQAQLGIDRIDIGVQDGTPRMVFEEAGSLTNWLIDSSAGAFRWFTPGVVQMSLQMGSILTLNNTGAEFRLGNPTDTVITRINAAEIAVGGIRLVKSGPPVTKTADFTVAAGETNIINNKAGSACVATLPSAAGFPGRQLMFNNEQAQALNSASANVVPQAGGAAGTAILPATAGAWALLVSNGVNWKRMMGGT